MSEHNCDDALKNLYVYLDNELDAVTSEGIREHIEQCGECFGSFDFEIRLKRVVRERLSEEVPQKFLEKLRVVIARDARAR